MFEEMSSLWRMTVLVLLLINGVIGAVDITSATSTFPVTIPVLQTASLVSEPATYGTLISQLNTTGHATEAPVAIATRIAVSAVQSPSPSALNAVFAATTAALAPNIFVPVDLKAPPSQFQRKSTHPQKAANLIATAPIHTNKFYTNFLLGSQKNPIFTHPYSLQFTNCAQTGTLCGMSVSHILRSQTAYGPGSPAAYYLNPIGIRGIVFSSEDLGFKPVLFTDSPRQFSINAYLSKSAGGKALIGFPIVQGMGFVTSIWYGNTTPLIRSGVFFTSLFSAGTVNKYGTAKYKALLADGNYWLIYVSPYVDGLSTAMVLKNSSIIQGTPNFNGLIQVAKLPQDPAASANAEMAYDKTAGAYATRGVLSGSVSGSTGTYSISWEKSGLSKITLMMYLLPHQVASLSSNSKSALVTAAQLDTTTKGKATAIVADRITLIEPSLPISVLFDPYSPNGFTAPSAISSSARQMIAYAANLEMGQNFSAQATGPSMYWNGKALGKFAMLVYATHAFAQNDNLASTGLQKLKSAFALFVNNAQQHPLVYDQQWGGVVSSASYVSGDPNVDYGNSYYNDHHFHYGYFVYAASVIAYLDNTWANTPANRDFVNTLIRDYGNSVETDLYFPISRMFDWWHGHSWADGLFESGDSKNEESSSEDMMSAYGIKMWGKAIGDVNMEARGNLQLAILRRSLQSYFLLQSDNTVEPAQFTGNKAVGILFENKVDHATYFGLLPEYIEGIHMLPLCPPSGYIRTPTFVSEEWNTYFSNGRINKVAEPWRSILYANLALTDPKTSWNYFNNPKFAWSQVDSGASWTWYLSYVAGLRGAS